MVERPNESWLAELDQLRYEDPSEALAQLEGNAHRVPRELGPLFLGVCGSSYRTLAGRSTRPDQKLKKAEDHILFGQWVANRLGAPTARADLDLRLSYVVADRGDYAKALSIAERACGIFDRAGDATGRGKALADQGQYLIYLKRHQEAAHAYSIALRLIPAEEVRYRFSCFQALGLCSLRADAPEEALKFAELAGQQIPGRWFEAKLRWLQSKICLALSDLAEAERHAQSTTEIFFRLHYGEAALASCELVSIQLLQGRAEAAWDTAARARQLVLPLSENRVVAAAIAELLRGGQEALTLERVEKVRSAIEEARERRDWRSLTKSWT